MGTDDLSVLKDDMVAFIAGLGLRRMRAYVPDDVPSVMFEFEDDDADAWKDFVEHAKAADAPFLTMSEVVLEPEDVGKIGYLQLGFTHGGVVFMYESATDWYDQFQSLMETVTELGRIIVDDRDDD